MFSSSYVQKVLYSVASMFKRSYAQRVLVQKVLCSEGSMFRSSYIQKLIMFTMSFIKKKRETAQTAPQEETQGAERWIKANISCTWKGDCMRSRGLRKSRRSERCSLGHREISGTRHDTKMQCKKWRGVSHSGCPSSGNLGSFEIWSSENVGSSKLIRVYPTKKRIIKFWRK